MPHRSQQGRAGRVRDQAGGRSRSATDVSKERDAHQLIVAHLSHQRLAQLSWHHGQSALVTHLLVLAVLGERHPVAYFSLSLGPARRVSQHRGAAIQHIDKSEGRLHGGRARVCHALDIFVTHEGHHFLKQPSLFPRKCTHRRPSRLNFREQDAEDDGASVHHTDCENHFFGILSRDITKAYRREHRVDKIPRNNPPLQRRMRVRGPSFCGEVIRLVLPKCCLLHKPVRAGKEMAHERDRYEHLPSPTPNRLRCQPILLLTTFSIKASLELKRSEALLHH